MLQRSWNLFLYLKFITMHVKIWPLVADKTHIVNRWLLISAPFRSAVCTIEFRDKETNRYSISFWQSFKISGR